MHCTATYSLSQLNIQTMNDDDSSSMSYLYGIIPNPLSEVQLRNDAMFFFPMRPLQKFVHYNDNRCGMQHSIY